MLKHTCLIALWPPRLLDLSKDESVGGVVSYGGTIVLLALGYCIVVSSPNSLGSRFRFPVVSMELVRKAINPMGTVRGTSGREEREPGCRSMRSHSSCSRSCSSLPHRYAEASCLACFASRCTASTSMAVLCVVVSYVYMSYLLL